MTTIGEEFHVQIEVWIELLSIKSVPIKYGPLIDSISRCPVSAIGRIVERGSLCPGLV
jgi:hypothetical protein